MGRYINHVESDMTKKIKTLLITVLLFTIQAQIGNAQCFAGVSADSDVVATAKGFVVTKADVEKVKQYYNKTPIRTVEAEYHVVTLNLLLFVHEALALHLDKDVKIPQEGTDSVEYWVALSDVYWKDVIAKYPISGQVIDSYYRVFPERFQKGDTGVSSVECRPPDPEIAQRIRMLLLSRKKSAIYQDIVAKLREKYSVRTIGFK